MVLLLLHANRKVTSLTHTHIENVCGVVASKQWSKLHVSNSSSFICRASHHWSVPSSFRWFNSVVCSVVVIISHSFHMFIFVSLHISSVCEYDPIQSDTFGSFHEKSVFWFILYWSGRLKCCFSIWFQFKCNRNTMSRRNYVYTKRERFEWWKIRIRVVFIWFRVRVERETEQQ